MMTLNRNDFETTGALSEICADVFSLILSLQASSDFGRAVDLDRKITKRLEKMEEKAEELHFAREDIQRAKFALVAFIDETIMNSPWVSKNTWRKLQHLYFNTIIAGEEFFERLERVRGDSSKAAVLEIYYLCLMLGFKGKLERSPKEHQDYIDEICKKIKSKPSNYQLSPNGGPRKFIDRGRPKVPWWVWATLGVYGISMAVILSFKFGLI